jgi:hypothetical protein
VPHGGAFAASLGQGAAPICAPTGKNEDKRKQEERFIAPKTSYGEEFFAALLKTIALRVGKIAFRNLVTLSFSQKIKKGQQPFRMTAKARAKAKSTCRSCAPRVGGL